jgi:hypothetical protein
MMQELQELEVTFSRVISVWWLLVWRSMLGAVVFGGIAGFIVGVAFGVLQLPFDSRFPGIAGAIAGFVWFIVVVRMALRKKYETFRIALLPHSYHS